MSLLTLLVLLSLSPARDYQLQPLSPGELTRDSINYRLLSGQRLSQGLDRIQMDRIQSSNQTCFTMRSYIFKREDGNAPELVGTTTCTPSSVVRNRTVNHPAPRLVLLK